MRALMFCAAALVVAAAAHFGAEQSCHQLGRPQLLLAN